MEWSWRIDTKSHLTQYKYRWSQTEIFVAMCVHRYIGWCTNIYFFALSALERLKEIAASSSEHSWGPDLGFWHCFPTKGPRRLGEMPAPSREQGKEICDYSARSRKWGHANRPDKCHISKSQVHLCKNAPTKGYFIFILFYFIFYCSGFCHTLKWISHGFTCVPHPDTPSHLPLHPLPLGLPSAPGPSACLMHPTWAGDLFHPR